MFSPPTTLLSPQNHQQEQSLLQPETVQTTTQTGEVEKEKEDEEGIRLKKLRQSLAAALQITVKACSYEKIAQAFPSLARDAPEPLRSAQEQIVQFLQRNVGEEFEKILSQRNVCEKLNSVDLLQSEARSVVLENGECPPSSFQRPDPETAVLARSLPLKREELDRLTRETEKYRTENANLSESLVERRRKLAETAQLLKSSIEKLDRSTEIALRDVPVREMRLWIDKTVPAFR